MFYSEGTDNLTSEHWSFCIGIKDIYFFKFPLIFFGKNRFEAQVHLGPCITVLNQSIEVNNVVMVSVMHPNQETSQSVWKFISPSIQGMSIFEGKILHTRDYRTPACFEGKQVVVVGAGNSGADVAAELSSVADKVFFYNMKELWFIFSTFLLFLNMLKGLLCWHGQPANESGEPPVYQSIRVKMLFITMIMCHKVTEFMTIFKVTRFSFNFWRANANAAELCTVNRGLSKACYTTVLRHRESVTMQPLLLYHVSLTGGLGTIGLSGWNNLLRIGERTVFWVIFAHTRCYS